MARRAEPSSYGHPKRGKLRQLLGDLRLLRSEMLELEASCRDAVGNAHAEHSPSARNLMHYLALRRHDIRPLQSRLANIGLSSLGRSEPHTRPAQIGVSLAEFFDGVRVGQPIWWTTGKSEE